MAASLGKIVALLAGFGALLSAAACTSTQPMPLGAAVLAPPGFTDLCGDRPRQCDLAEAGSAVSNARYRIMRQVWQGVFTAPAMEEVKPPFLRLDSEKQAFLDRVNLTVDERMGVAADCKARVLAKRQALAEAGLPPQSLSIAVVETRQGEPHAVLLVATDQGDMVLDNRSRWVTPWAETGYRWIERQAPGTQWHWVDLRQVAAAAP